MAETPDKKSLIKNAFSFFAYLLIVWSFYRFWFRYPEWLEETVIKPIIWLLPMFYYVISKEKRRLSSIGYTFKGFAPAIYLAFGLGFVFIAAGALTNYLKYGGINLSANISTLPIFIALGISFATAVSEESVFRGYIFTRLWSATKNEWQANITTTFLWILIHIPVVFFVWEMNLNEAVVYLVLTAIFGFGSALVFARSKNIISSILLHLLWVWPIIIFR